MAGGAGVVSAAGMLQMNAEIEGDVEQGFRLAVIFVGQLPGFEFHRHIGGKKSNLGHTFSIASRGPLEKSGPCSRAWRKSVSGHFLSGVLCVDPTVYSFCRR